MEGLEADAVVAVMLLWGGVASNRDVIVFYRDGGGDESSCMKCSGWQKSDQDFVGVQEGAWWEERSPRAHLDRLLNLEDVNASQVACEKRGGGGSRATRLQHGSCKYV